MAGPRTRPWCLGGAFDIWDGLVPANRLFHSYRTRLRAALIRHERNVQRRLS